MNKHAYLIIAHNDIEHLQRLISAIDTEYNDIFLHFDKSQYDNYNVDSLKTEKSKLFVYSQFSVHWGSFSIVECELLLLKKAINGNYSYYHLLSGSDYLLKSADTVYHFFEKEQKQFVLFTDKEIAERYLDWVRYKHYGTEKFKTGKNRFVNKCIELYDNLMVKVQKICRFQRKLSFEAYQKGSQWFSITDSLARIVVSEEDKIRADFVYAFTPDEMVIQTIICSHHLLNQVYDLENTNCYCQNMRYIDWNRGRPYVFQQTDFRELIDSDAMFARKFSSSCPEIVDLLEQYISQFK